MVIFVALSRWGLSLHLSPLGRGKTLRVLLHPLDRHGQALADADAQGRERRLAAGLLKLVNRGKRQPRARHAERMAERDRAAVGIDVPGVVRKSKLAQHRERLR